MRSTVKAIYFFFSAEPSYYNTLSHTKLQNKMRAEVSRSQQAAMGQKQVRLRSNGSTKSKRNKITIKTSGRKLVQNAKTTMLPDRELEGSKTKVIVN